MLGNMSCLARFAISKDTWRPSELLLINTWTKRVAFRYRIEDYHQYPDGVWFPRHVVVTQLTMLGRPVSEDDCRLTDASFNKSADLKELKAGIPAGTVMDDIRLGSGKGVSYTLNSGHLPPLSFLWHLRSTEGPSQRPVP